MHETILKKKAIDLRTQGFSYSEILKQVSVAKSTLSLWLREVGLSKRQRQRLTEKKLLAMSRGWETIRSRRIRKCEEIYKKSREEAESLMKTPLWLTGTVLYWAEGGKEKSWRTGERMSFSNMDSRMHKIFLEWVKKYLDVKDNHLVFELYIHENADVKKAKEFWSKEMNIPTSRLRVYFKRHTRKYFRKNYEETYNGLLRIRINRSVDLNRKIAGWTEGVVQYFAS